MQKAKTNSNISINTIVLTQPTDIELKVIISPALTIKTCKIKTSPLEKKLAQILKFTAIRPQAAIVLKTEVRIFTLSPYMDPIMSAIEILLISLDIFGSKKHAAIIKDSSSPNEAIKYHRPSIKISYIKIAEHPRVSQVNSKTDNNVNTE
ncbi:MAG TPA: hypothetical protein QKA08_01420 [Candidatus Megaira endosymbiont of Nemacystus decipiens]|nr:hypothetical protein [Candidatus Megaera endosymbiont of Nemacystus decipiens]